VGVLGDSVSRLAAKHDVSAPIAARQWGCEHLSGMGDAGAAEDCKVDRLVGFAEGCVLSDIP